MNKLIPIQKDGWPEAGLLRCDQIVSPGGPLPLSKSQFWVLVKQLGIPTVKLSERVTSFWVHDLRLAFFGDARPPGPRLLPIGPKESAEEQSRKTRSNSLADHPSLPPTFPHGAANPTLIQIRDVITNPSDR